MRLVIGIALVLLGQAASLGQAPDVKEREDDLASLASFVREKAASIREGYAAALEAAGDNRVEIEAAGERLTTRREKLLFVWLVAHMKGKFFAKLEESRWVPVNDLETARADLLFHTVRYAVAARDRFPWCRNLPWDLFLNFVLPYRGSQEPLEDYRPVLWKELVPLVEGAVDASRALEAVNGWAAGKVKEDRTGGQDRGMLEMLKEGKGRHEDLANFLTACASTVGIPCTSVFTPWWAKKDGNAIWCEANIQGRWRSFAPCGKAEGGLALDAEKKEGAYAKVYRKYFAEPEASDTEYGEDVTADYAPVADLVLDAGKASAKMLLAVWNSGGWRRVARAESDADGKVAFRGVGCREPAVLMAYFEAEQPEPAAGPLIFGPGGAVRNLMVDPVERNAPNLRPVKFSGYMPDATYALLAFDGSQWRPLARATVRFAGALDLGRVGRENTLYIIVRVFGERSFPEGRPFLLEFGEDGKAVRKGF